MHFHHLRCDIHGQYVQHINYSLPHRHYLLNCFHQHVQYDEY
ncbi:unnamed protein product [Schistosoma curassoni]|uniref:Uncharacterized protein n=1 Tax=Schistosoma curassoni TaxID=6186 RepID=A0A183JIZ7_9TREM|nr:unnamed protein product [Schistosoma curassoni]